jgi:LmbE family N-acetylglucosaminyl deacetylase
MERAVNLCFPDGRLAEMRQRPERDFRTDGEEPHDFEGLRRLNSSSLVSQGGFCSWQSLVSDLCQILARTKPSIIVTPHPGLDSHSDHVAATAAMAEALALAGLSKGRFFYTCIHNRCSELWPFGPLGSGVAHLPVLPAEGKQASRFYSHALSPTRQLEKFLALEAMHDLRQIAWPEKHSLGRAARRFRRELKALRNGLDPRPVNYLRRGVRPDEPFFVEDFTAALEAQEPEQRRGFLGRQ